MFAASASASASATTSAAVPVALQRECVEWMRLSRALGLEEAAEATRALRRKRKRAGQDVADGDSDAEASAEEGAAVAVASGRSSRRRSRAQPCRLQCALGFESDCSVTDEDADDWKMPPPKQPKPRSNVITIVAGPLKPAKEIRLPPVAPSEFASDPLARMFRAHSDVSQLLHEHKQRVAVQQAADHNGHGVPMLSPAALAASTAAHFHALREGFASAHAVALHESVASAMRTNKARLRSQQQIDRRDKYKQKLAYNVASKRSARASASATTPADDEEKSGEEENEEDEEEERRPHKRHVSVAQPDDMDGAAASPPDDDGDDHSAAGSEASVSSNSDEEELQ